MTLLRYLTVVLSLVVCGLLGCDSQKPATGPKAAKTPAVSPPPPPPPPPVAASAASRAQATASPAGTIPNLPAWAGQRSDEPFDVKAFLASRLPAENAAPLYQAPLGAISREMGGDQAGNLDDQIKNLADVERLASGEAAPQQVDQVLSAAAAAITQLDAAQAKPTCVFMTGLTADAALPHAMGARNVTRLSVLQLQQARNKGDFRLAEHAIRRGLRMSRDLRPRGPAVCQLVSIADETLLLRAVELITIAEAKLAADQCDRLLATLIDHEKQGLDRLGEGLRVDYIVFRNAIDDLQSGRMSLDKFYEAVLGDGAGGRGPSSQLVWNHEAEIAACNRLYALAISEPNALSLDPRNSGRFRSAINECKSAWARFKSELDATAPAQRNSLKGRMPSHQFATWTASIEPLAEANRRAATNLVGLQMLIAVRRYHIKHRSLPASLDAAAKETALKSTPLDPYSGQPLRLAVVDGRPTIYSIGKDLKDDGGRVDWKHGTQPGDYLFVLPRTH